MNFKKHKLVKWPYIATVFALFLTLPNKVLAVDALTRLVTEVYWTYFVYPMVLALELALELLKIVASYNNFTSEVGVTLGWIALRDLSNMFFILIFLIIGFATILRISNYGYKELLKRTIIIAIIINFSKTIVGFFIDVVQVVMLTFISAINEAMTGGLVVAVGLQKFTTISLSGDGMDYIDYIASLVLGGILVAIFLVIVGVMVMMLMMRVVALWVAIVLSPLAFLSNIFPATQSFYRTWLKQLGTNLVTGPMLAFFLWLSISIAGNGEAYDSFTSFDARTTGNAATTFLDTTNIVNYIVSISLLLIGIKTAATSGAAGANFATKGMNLIQSKAGQLARRYPMAMGQRVAAGISKGVMDNKGNFKDNKLGKALKGVSKLPFYGGRLQRGLMNMQGRSSVRAQEEQSADEKNILPQHSVPFEATYASGADSEFKSGDIPGLGRLLNKTGLGNIPVGKIYSKIGSWGGDTERKAMMYKNALARGEIKSEDAQSATDSFRAMGWEDEMQKVQMEHATYDNKEEAIRLIRKVGGVAPLITNLKSDSFMEDELDDEGQPIMEEVIDPETGQRVTRKKQHVKKEMEYLLDAIADPEHGYADHNTISQATLKMDKVDRWRFNDAMRDRLNRNGSFDENVIDVGKGGAALNKRGSFDVNLTDKDVVEGEALGKTYVQKIATQIDENTGDISDVGVFYRFWTQANEQLKEAYIAPGNIGSSMADLQGVDAVEMNHRRDIAGMLDKVSKDTKFEDLPAYVQKTYGIKGADGKQTLDWNEFEKFRQDMYQQVLDIKPWTLDPTIARSEFDGTDEEYKKLISRTDYGDQSYVFDEKVNPDLGSREDRMRLYAIMHAGINIPRSDILNQKETLAKETKEGEAERKKIFAQADDPQEAERKYNETLLGLKQIDRLRDDDNQVGQEMRNRYGEKGFEELLRKMMADQVGDKRHMYDPITRAFFTELTDGADGSRFMEANVRDRYESITAKQALERSENKQQSQAFAVAIGEQEKFLLHTLAELGKLPQKILMDNSSKTQAAIAMQKYRDANHFQTKGILPQDLSILGNNLRYLSAVVRQSAINQGYANKDATGKALAKGVAKYFEKNPVMKKKMDTLELVFKEKVDYGTPNEYDDAVQHADYNPRELDKEDNDSKSEQEATISKEKKKKAAKEIFKEGSGLDEV